MDMNCVCVKSERLDEPRPEELASYCVNRSNLIRARNLAAARELLYYVQINDFDQFKRLLETKPDLNVLFKGQTVLHYCLLFGRDVSWCKQLVSNGANPNLSNLDGWHPIHLAAFTGSQETLNYLISVNQHHRF